MGTELFAGVAVSDLPRAIDWYERLPSGPVGGACDWPRSPSAPSSST